MHSPTQYAIQLERRTLIHAGREASPDARGVHAQNELIYQESRAQAEAARAQLSDAVLSGFDTYMGANVRIWVRPQPSAEQTSRPSAYLPAPPPQSCFLQA